MKKLLCSANLLAILVLVLAGIFISGAAKPESQNNDVYVYDPNAPKTIAIEAYLAQIPDEALIEIGLPLIPTKESEAITVDKLLKCLTSTKVKGKIISSGRWTTKELNNCKIEQNSTIYVQKKNTITSESGETTTTNTIEGYDSGTHGDICASLTESNKISLSISFKYAGIFQNNEEKADNETPPARIRYTLDTNTIVNNDVPVITGATKNSDSVLYLVVRAKVLDE